MEHNLKSHNQLINFLQEQLTLSASTIALLLHKCDDNPGFLLLLLWRYDLVSLGQLKQIFEWLES